MASKKDSTSDATGSKREVARAMTEVGGVRSSDDSVPDLHGSGELTEERRDATCSAEVKSSKGCERARGEGRQPRDSASDPLNPVTRIGREAQRRTRGTWRLPHSSARIGSELRIK